MRQTRWIGLAALFVSLLAAGSRADARSGENQTARLRAAAQALLSEPGEGHVDVGPPLTVIVGILAEVSAPAKLAEPVRAKVEAAHARLLAGTSPLDPEIVASVAEAYAALHQGRRFAFPADVKTLAQAKVACSRAIDRAATALDAGRPREAAEGLVEFLMLIATPMERE